MTRFSGNRSSTEPTTVGEITITGPPSTNLVDTDQPPLDYPRRRPNRLLIGIVGAISVTVAVVTAAIVYVVRTHSVSSGAAFSEGAVKTAIQGYLNALEHRDTEALVHSMLCGIYDGVRDRQSDQALAKLSSDAFRKQYSQAEVISIDQIVHWSQYQTQALFTMQVAPAGGGPQRTQVQGVAQLLSQRDQILMCSYVLRTAGPY